MSGDIPVVPYCTTSSETIVLVDRLAFGSEWLAYLSTCSVFRDHSVPLDKTSFLMVPCTFPILAPVISKDQVFFEHLA